MTRPNPHIALIYHYDLARALAGEVVDWQIIPVNVQAGREGGDLCRLAADFAKRRDLFAMPAPSAPTNPAVVEQAVDPEPSLGMGAVPGSAATELDPLRAHINVGTMVEPHLMCNGPADRDKLRDRIKDLLHHYLAADHLLRQWWPEGVPTLKHDGHTDDQLEQILAVVRRVEAEVGASWVEGDVTSRSGAINRARKAWKDSGRDEAELWFAAVNIATFKQCQNPDTSMDVFLAQFTIEQADRLHDAAKEQR